MIISRTPFRMSFFGGGTDYPVWYREHGGATLAAAIDKYCYISCRYLPPFFEHRSRILYSKVEMVRDNREIEHPSVRACLQEMKINEGVEIHHDGDLPARTGLGSSSSFTVGLLHALYAMKGVMPTAMRLAQQAIHVEQDVLCEHVGCQDQVTAAFGGLNRIQFCRNDEIRVTPVIVSQSRVDELQSYLMLFFTGFARTASEIAKEQIERTKDRVAELTALGHMVDEGIAVLAGQESLTRFGRLLHEAWELKRRLSPRITTPTIDAMYAAARGAGALGGKLLGAGGGGFMVIFAKPEDHRRIRAALPGCLNVPFRFDYQGSQIIVYQPDELPLVEDPSPLALHDDDLASYAAALNQAGW